MKNEIIIPDHFPDAKEEDLKVADLRREEYSHRRDLLAREFNEAIANRLLAMDRNQIKCEKCGKEFAAGTTVSEVMICPECKVTTENK